MYKCKNKTCWVHIGLLVLNVFKVDHLGLDDLSGGSFLGKTDSDTLRIFQLPGGFYSVVGPYEIYLVCLCLGLV